LRGKYDLSFTVPSQCAEALRTGRADVAIIPAIEYQRILSDGVGLTILPGLAIASKERVRSLLLISKVPVRNARRIALDRSSRSTQALVKILAARQWQIAAEFVEADPEPRAMLTNADAALVIGDIALRIAIAAETHLALGPDGEWLTAGANAGVLGISQLHIYDVVAEWSHLTQKPAVLAVWAARNDSFSSEVMISELAEDFLASQAFGLAHLPEICAEASREMCLPEKEICHYLEKNIDYTLDDKNLEGLQRFWALSSALGITGPLQPAIIAAHSKSTPNSLSRNSLSSRA
jgi:chorismate dehydratase